MTTPIRTRRLDKKDQRQNERRQRRLPLMDVIIRLRVPSEKRAAWMRAADLDDRKLSDWIRARCDGRKTTAPEPRQSVDRRAISRRLDDKRKAKLRTRTSHS